MNETEYQNALAAIKANKGKVYGLYGDKISYIDTTVKGEHIVITRRHQSGKCVFFTLDDSGLFCTFTDAVLVEGEQTTLCWSY